MGIINKPKLWWSDLEGEQAVWQEYLTSKVFYTIIMNQMIAVMDGNIHIYFCLFCENSAKICDTFRLEVASS